MKIVNPNTLNKIEEEYKPIKDTKEYEPRLTVRVFVLDADKNIGLIKHKKDERWFPPGGGVEEGETIFETAKREVIEELGVECDPVEDLGVLNQYHEIWMKNFEIHHLFAATNKKEVKIDYEEYDTDLERVWMNVHEYRNLLVDYVENKTPNDIWARAILYFLEELIIHSTRQSPQIPL